LEAASQAANFFCGKRRRRECRASHISECSFLLIDFEFVYSTDRNDAPNH
jgi:hypothetical protein